jgi:sugar phosphate isomerase/epimerase
MRRRQMIRTLTGGMATVLAGESCLARAQTGKQGRLPTQSRKPLLGFSSYGMRTIPVHEAIGHIAQIGYKALELTIMPTWETEPKLLSRTKRAEIRKQIGDLGLVLYSVQDSLQLADPNTLGNPNFSKKEKLERLRAAAAVAHELSPGAAALIETAVGGRTAAWEEKKNEMAEELGEWAKTLEPLKTVLAIKAFVGSVVDRPERVLWLLDQVRSPWIRCGYDYSHLKLLGLSLRNTMLQLGSHIVFVHVKDSLGTEQKYQFLLPGDSGTINYKEYVQLLGEVGYSGAVLVEVSVQVSGQPGYDGVAAAKHSFDNLASFFA